MLFFKCCTHCSGDLLLEADDLSAVLKCLSCDRQSSVPANTHLFEVLCQEHTFQQTEYGSDIAQAA